MLVIKRVVKLLTDHSVVEANVEVQKRDYWLVHLYYRHISATLVFNGGYSVGDPITPGDPGSLLEGTGLWYVPDGTPVDIASFLAGWMIGRAEAPPGSPPAIQFPRMAPGQPHPHRSGNEPGPSERVSPSAFLEGQHRARLDPDE